MKVVVDINHPAHVHLFKNFIRQMESKGHELLITASEKDVALQLLDNYGFKYDQLGSYGSSLISKLAALPLLDLKMYKAAKSFKADIFIGMGSIRAAHAAKILKKPCIIFEDTEHSTEQIVLYAPFADVIFTPVFFKGELGGKQVRYNGCHELAYLHPHYFKPDPSVLQEAGLSDDDNFFVLRLAAFNATHDSKSKNLSRDCIMALVAKLEQAGTVFISAETDLEPALQKYQYNLNPAKYHDLIHYARMYIGDGSTSAVEAAVLGVPSLQFEKIKSNGREYGFDEVCGLISELQDKYGLLCSFHDEYVLLQKVDEMLADLANVNANWKARRDQLLREKIDVTDFMVSFVENYPESLTEIRK
ncbi:MAG: DUF354 domain-containing protein [Desulfotomaculaceae bacterium]|nr:DUF354 domain-containing protein [Desulfotomaculaceae bacterium]